MLNRFRYLRVSLLNECNLSCSYCKPEGYNRPASRLTPLIKFADSIELLHKFGIRKIRFTGGEPTLYKQLPELVSFVSGLSSDVTTAMTSNALLLEKKAKLLGEVGLNSVNISLDTLDRTKFHKITGRDALSQTLASIDQAIKHIPSVKLNCVVMAGVNDNEIVDLIKYADRCGIDIRFIEYMPNKFNSEQNKQYISGAKTRTSLPFELVPVLSPVISAARYYSSDDFSIRVGFIDPVSHSFCGDCDRVRLTSDGNLYGCLFSGKKINLYELLSGNIDAARQKLNDLIASKDFRGCSAVQSVQTELPSFVNMGG